MPKLSPTVRNNILIEVLDTFRATQRILFTARYKGLTTNGNSRYAYRVFFITAARTYDMTMTFSTLYGYRATSDFEEFVTGDKPYEIVQRMKEDFDLTGRVYETLAARTTISHPPKDCSPVDKNRLVCDDRR